jgi:arylsulfatase
MIKRAGQAEGARVPGLVSLMDFLPTMLALVGAPPYEAARGRDLFEGGSAADGVLVENSDQYPVKVLGLRSEGWKYLRRESDGHEELYDLEADPGETTSVAAEHPERLAEMRGRFEALLSDYRASVVAVPTTGEPDDEETREALEDLGYF